MIPNAFEKSSPFVTNIKRPKMAIPIKTDSLLPILSFKKIMDSTTAKTVYSLPKKPTITGEIKSRLAYKKITPNASKKPIIHKRLPAFFTETLLPRNNIAR
jgi:hypothetical protein